ncbi:protein arginine N-methyltransferase 9-like [Anneissia japonica]|uniref:protein arginine N-methyltransferase 9-like n=1 Tax=Anneissia japonica TaxID=1529436 RepID=UPI001425AC52|nr:protein arginine N-methyltransferase 9-like [Anneissia japonica]
MEKDQLVESSLNSARFHFQNNHHGMSFAYYLLALKLSPEQKQNLRKEFGDVFREWVNELLRQDRCQDIFECYAQALDVFPDNEWVQDVMGSHLYRLGFADEAVLYFRQALKLNPNLHSARESLNNLLNALVERWHFRMLNDKWRNTAYKDAIHRAVKTAHGPMNVLDIGAGTGILSMFAVQAGANEVYACEMSKTMAGIAQDVLRANQMLDKIHILQMKSTDMQIPDNLPSRVSLVVTETLDSGLLGEGILDTVHHAWNHLLLPPDEKGGGGRVIPSGATVFAMLIECEHIRKHHSVISKSIGGILLDFTIVSPSVNLMSDSGITDVRTVFSEPYTSEEICSLPGGYTALSSVIKVEDFNFNNPQEVAELCSHKSLPKALTVPVARQGNIDAIVVWFDLYLDSQTSISTSPWSEGCWEKAVYPITAGNIKGGVTEVKSGETVNLEVVCKENHLAFQCIKIKSVNSTRTESQDLRENPQIETVIDNQHLSQDISRVMPLEIQNHPTSTFRYASSRQTSKGSSCKLLPSEKNCPRVLERDSSGVCVKQSWQLKHESGLEETSSTSKKSEDSLQEMSDLSWQHLPSMKNPPLGSSGGIGHKECLLERNTKSNKVFVMEEKDIFTLNDLWYQVQICETIQKAVDSSLTQRRSSETRGNDHITSDLGKNWQVLDISEGVSLAVVYAADAGATRIHVSHQHDTNLDLVLDLCKQKHYNIGSEDIQTLVSELHSDVLWDVLVVDIVEPSGLLRHNIWQEVALVRDTILQLEGVIIPSGITIHCMCIDSKWILENSYVVDNSRTLDFDIKPFMNSFTVPTHPGIFFSKLQCIQLSTAIELMHIDLRDIVLTNQPVKPTFKIEQKKQVEIETDGCLMAVLFWFDLKLDTYRSISTLNPATHFSQSVYILSEQFQVSAGERLCLSFFLEDSSISFKVQHLVTHDDSSS